VCSADGRALARAIGGELVRAGFLVVSGGADGIDTAAHEGALDAGGRTAMVLGMGLGVAERDHALWRRVIDGGGVVVSPLDEQAKHHRSNYFLRNELMALLGEVTIVVERQSRSGAANTTAHARRHGRVVLAVPQSPWSVGRGCIDELQLGARPVRDAADVLAALGHAPPVLTEPPTPVHAAPASALRAGASSSQTPHSPPAPARATKRARGAAAAAPAAPKLTRSREQIASLLAGLEEVERSIVLALADKSRSLGELCDRLPAEPPALAVALFALECRGLIRNQFGFHSLGGPLAGAGPALVALRSEADAAGVSPSAAR
jgi:DNA processing protein